MDPGISRAMNLAERGSLEAGMGDGYGERQAGRRITSVGIRG